jgi:hypothetical protein
MTEGSTTYERDSPATFLLIIPGTTLIGVGIGLTLQNALPGGLIGFGVGFVLWGLLLELRLRRRHSSSRK